MEKEYHPISRFSLNLNSRGGLEEGSYWDQNVAEELARMNGIGPLTADHWRVIDFVRQYYLEHGTGPSTHKIYRATGFRLQRLFELFPGAITWNAHYMAGLPDPGKAHRKEESGFHSGTDRASFRPPNSDVSVPFFERAEVRTGLIPIAPRSRWRAVWGFMGQHSSFARLADTRKIAWAAVLIAAVISVGVLLRTSQENKNMRSNAPVPMTRVEARIGKGVVEIPLDLVKKKRLVSFEYRGKYGELPLIAYSTASGKIVTAVGVSTPCHSESFHLEGNEMVCNICFTRWDLDTLKGVSGECLANAPDLIPHFVQKGKLFVTETDIRNWQPMAVRG